MTRPGEQENPLYPLGAHAQRVAAARKEAESAGIPMLVNAGAWRIR